MILKGSNCCSYSPVRSPILQVERSPPQNLRKRGATTMKHVSQAESAHRGTIPIKSPDTKKKRKLSSIPIKSPARARRRRRREFNRKREEGFRV
jgi:hypothetical protein